MHAGPYGQAAAQELLPWTARSPPPSTRLPFPPRQAATLAVHGGDAAERHGDVEAVDECRAAGQVLESGAGKGGISVCACRGRDCKLLFCADGHVMGCKANQVLLIYCQPHMRPSGRTPLEAAASPSLRTLPTSIKSRDSIRLAVSCRRFRMSSSCASVSGGA